VAAAARLTARCRRRRPTHSIKGGFDVFHRTKGGETRGKVLKRMSIKERRLGVGMDKGMDEKQDSADQNHLGSKKRSPFVQIQSRNLSISISNLNQIKFKFNQSGVGDGDLFSQKL
jgi:hypothetical protein